jgi:CRP-like cAMP-binding protein
VTSPEQLARFCVFERLTPAQLATVARAAWAIALPAGTRLFEQGQPADGCWLISHGQVALGTFVPGQGEVVVHTLGPGDVLGWSWLVPPHRWEFTATASGPVTGLRVDTDQLHALADADPALGYPLSLGLLDAALARLQVTRSRLMDLYGSPRGR